MFDIRITDIKEAVISAGRGWSEATVSLVDPDILHGFPTWHNHLIVGFDDVEQDWGRYKAPTIEDIQLILDFTKNQKNQDCKLLVHCHAGISRSTAMAMAIWVQQGMTPPMAAIEVKKIRHQTFPNSLIAKYADIILNLHGRLESNVNIMKNISIEEMKNDEMQGIGF